MNAIQANASGENDSRVDGNFSSFISKRTAFGEFRFVITAILLLFMKQLSSEKFSVKTVNQLLGVCKGTLSKTKWTANTAGDLSLLFSSNK